MTIIIGIWTSIDPDKNRFRYYALGLGRDLWGEEVLIKRWGRIGDGKREALYWPHNYQDLLAQIDQVATRRKKHGYRLTLGLQLIHSNRRELLSS